MREDLPSGTVTFLFTDVEGSTRLLEGLGADAYAEALAKHRRIIREACAAESGVEVDTQGDAFFFSFPTAPGALSAASALTEALATGPIRVRVGLHTGTPLVTDEGYVGADVHRAARIAAVGHGGQVLVSASAAQLVELELSDLGEHRLKDLSAPERVFQLGDSEFPALKSLYRTNLPIPSTPFLGRERELREVVELLSGKDSRLLTLTGPGGTGKTRLAAQAAGVAADGYPDGVWWVPLAALRDHELVLESASQVLGAQNGLASHIADKRMLLLFDNFEQVVEAAPGVSTLLGECPHLELIVTSREPLHLAGEQEYPVTPFVAEEGVDFFAARARAVKPDFEVDEVVPEICRRLDDLPLALELAASRVKALSTEQILSRLERRLPLLTGGSRDAPERQRTLRATIEWSHDLLTAEEQRLFADLSVFAGGCTLDAAEAVCGAELDTLHSLVDKSLLRFTRERYWMLATIQEFARDRLDDVTARELRQRHAEHFVALAEEANPHLREDKDPSEWLDRLEAEHDNFRWALDYLEAADGSLALRLVVGISELWRVRGYVSEGRRHFDRALAVAPTEGVALRLRALAGASEMARVQGDFETAKSQSHLRLDIARTISDWHHVGGALNNLSTIAVQEGDLETASELLEEAFEAFRLVDDPALRIAMGNRGYIALSRGELDEAAAFFDESLKLESASGTDEGMALALLNVGLASLALNRHDEARAAYVRGLRLAAGLGYRNWVAYAQEGLAAVSAARGRTDHALRLLALAAAVRGEIGTQRDPVEQEIHTKTLAAIQDSFSQEAIDAAFEEARQSTLDEAVTWALESVE